MEGGMAWTIMKVSRREGARNSFLLLERGKRKPILRRLFLIMRTLKRGGGILEA